MDKLETVLNSMKNFALIGAAGYIAPRHMTAIRDTGNRVVAALDPNDSVGILDSFFPDAHFFTEFERFDRFVDKRRREAVDERIEFVTIASPNYLHDSHMRFALRSDCDAICEKPLVLNPWNLDGLREVERDSGRRVHTILQLRVHPSIVALRERVERAPQDRKADVDLTYITSRGRWYYQSWKGDERKSGGIATNIGVHFFDMLGFLFGPLKELIVHQREDSRAGGYLEFERARVRWFMSLDLEDVPPAARMKGDRTYRSITVDGEEIEFSGGFTDLHTVSYQEILAGRGFGIEDNRAAIEIVSQIRTQPLEHSSAMRHPAVRAG